jgi:hypothetical protein
MSIQVQNALNKHKVVLGFQTHTEPRPSPGDAKEASRLASEWMKQKAQDHNIDILCDMLRTTTTDSKTMIATSGVVDDIGEISRLVSAFLSDCCSNKSRK